MVIKTLTMEVVSKMRCSFWIKSSWEENFGGPIGKTEGQNRTTHTTKFVVHFLLPYRIGLRFVPHCCIRQASRLLLELRERNTESERPASALSLRHPPPSPATTRGSVTGHITCPITGHLSFLAQKRQQRDLT